MAQCGGIGVAELNKLELELCERLQWKLLPTVADIRELIDAMQTPQASFWDAWQNGPRSRLAVPTAFEYAHRSRVRACDAKRCKPVVIS